MNADQARARDLNGFRGLLVGLALSVLTWAALAGCWWLASHHPSVAGLLAGLLAAGAARAMWVHR